MEWFLKVVRNHYFDFAGRARRKEYWMFVLIQLILVVAVSVVGGMIKQPWIASVVSLALLLPALGVAARRLHDIGKSGWLLLISLIPVLGALYLIYLLAQEGVRGSNAYGADPKAA